MRNGREFELTLQYGREIFGGDFSEERTESLLRLVRQSQQGGAIANPFFYADGPFDESTEITLDIDLSTEMVALLRTP